MRLANAATPQLKAIVRRHKDLYDRLVVLLAREVQVNSSAVLESSTLTKPSTTRQNTPAATSPAALGR